MLEKYKEIWDKVSYCIKTWVWSTNKIKKWFVSKPLHSKTWNLINVKIPEVVFGSICLWMILIESVLKIDGNNHPQEILEECKYIENGEKIH